MQWITLSVWVLITLLLSFTLPQVNSTKEPNPKIYLKQLCHSKRKRL
ncbi:hypothetical protein LQK80_17830 [Bacillus thuringiensis]|nr:hypothetical protein [Bacillus thuringiensis]